MSKVFVTVILWFYFFAMLYAFSDGIINWRDYFHVSSFLFVLFCWFFLYRNEFKSEVLDQDQWWLK